MDIKVVISIAEMAERGVLDAYYKMYNLDGASPATMNVTLTLAQAEKIGLKVELPSAAPDAGVSAVQQVKRRAKKKG
jgi:hypothetical protein